MLRSRLALVLASAALLTAGAGAAHGAITAAPELVTTLSTFTQSTAGGISLTWSASTFTVPTASEVVVSRRYRVSASDLTVPGVTEVFVDAPKPVCTNACQNPPTQATLPVINGHLYGSLRITAQETVCATINLTCQASVTPTATLPGTATSTRIDATPPSGTILVNGGAAVTNSRTVSVAVTATDPLTAAIAGSAAGVDFMQIFQGPLPFCAVAGQPDCQQPVPAGPVSYTLDPGADGIRSVRGRFEDAAVPPCQTPPCILPVGAVAGNQSALVADSILLDTTAPTARVTQSATTAAVNAQVKFDGSTSIDGTASAIDSGVDAATYQWSFGDGTSGTGAAPVHAYTTPGVYTGALTVKDVAGNTSAPAAITVTVPAPSAATPPPAPITIVNNPVTVITPTAKLSAKVRFRVAIGTRLQLLRLSVVGAPAGAKVGVACVKGCKLSRASLASGKAVNLATLFKGRALKPGLKLQIRVTKAGAIGQLFRYSITSAGVKGTECAIALDGTTGACTPA